MNLFAPSTEEASYKSLGICFSPARKITMVEPNCQTVSRISVPSAVSGLVIQLFPSIPKTAISLLKIPSTPKMLRQSSDTPILPPIREGNRSLCGRR